MSDVDEQPTETQDPPRWAAIDQGSWSAAHIDGTLVVALAGEIDCANASQLGERLKVEIQEVPSDLLVIDLSAVTFLDSSCIKLLIDAKRTIEARGGSQVLRGVRPQARRALEMAGVLGYLDDGRSASPDPA
jgi:stage II sporulation protein AA (anti-sigma F factor antagonist)